jgi:signal transduction histidine kinase
MWPLLAVAVASLAAVGAINVGIAGRQTRERIERQLQGVVGVLAESNFPLTDAVLRQMHELSRAEFILADAKGRPVASSLAERPASTPRGVEAADLERVTLGPPQKIFGASYFHTIVELPRRPAAGTARRLHVLFPETEYRRSWREAFMPSIVVGVAAVVAVAAVARVLGGRISRATATLSQEVVRLARGDFAAVELPATDDELRDLSVAVNRTAGMLAEYQEQLRRTEQMRTVAMLGAGLAHEMRNAATGCRIALDLHAERCRAGGDGESLEVAKRQLQLMESQLQRFLHVGKASRPGRPQPLDLVRLVDDRLSLVRPAMRHAGVDLEWTPAAGEALVLGDEEELGQVVVNLLLNAVEAVQQADGERRIAVHIDAGPDNRARLVVSDSGPGPSEEVAASLFEPFVTSKPEGVGLGLAVVRQLVENQQGRITWRREAERTSFTVELPMATKGLACV